MPQQQQPVLSERDAAILKAEPELLGGALPVAYHSAKAQPIRLMDVFILGPLMIWGGNKVVDKHPLGGAALSFWGIMAMVFNGLNWIEIRRLQQKGGVSQPPPNTIDT